MNQITNRNGQLLSVVGRTAVDAYAIRVLIGAMGLMQKGIKVNPRMGKKQLLLRAEQWLGTRPKTIEEAIPLLQVKMNEKVEECEVVNE